MLLSAEHPEPDQLIAFALGKLTDDSAVPIEDHLSQCESCCERLAEVAQDDSFTSLVRRCDPSEQTCELRESVSSEGTSLRGLPPIGRNSKERPEVVQLLQEHERYEVGELISMGGMGAVYRAMHRLMDREVALKVIRPEMLEKPAAVDRFRREVRAAARLDHPNIVRAFDAEQVGAQHILVMEYVAGVNLAEKVAADGPLPIAQVCDYARQVARGLQHAHEQGMVHRDIKPHNLMLTLDGQIKILDFGLANLMADENADDSLADPDAPTTVAWLTKASTMIGTPDYIAPEQVTDAHSADIRSDIYALGCTFYFLLTGQPPFASGSAIDKTRAHAERDPQPIHELRPDVPPEVVAVLNRMIAKDPAERFQTPTELLQALLALDKESSSANPFPADRRSTSRDRSWLGLCLSGAVLLATLIAAAVIYVRTDNGVIAIETDDPGVRVLVEQNGKQVTVLDPKTNQQVTLDTGTYSLRLGGDSAGFEMILPEGQPFSLKRGETKVVTVRPVRSTVPPPDGEQGQPENTATEQEITLLRKVQGHKSPIWRVKMWPGGGYVATGAALHWVQRPLLLWDMEKWRELESFAISETMATGRAQGKGSWVCCDFAVDRDGQIFAFQGSDQMRLLSVATGRVLHTMESEKNYSAIALAADGSVVFSTDMSLTLRAYDTRTGEELYHLRTAEPVYDLELSPDGKLLMWRDAEHLVLWDVENRKKSRRIEAKRIPDLEKPNFGMWRRQHFSAFSPDGSRAAVGSFDGSLALFDVQQGRQLARWQAHDACVTDVEFTPDGRHIISGSPDKRMAIWSAESQEKVAELMTESLAVNKFAVTPDGQRVISGGGYHWTPGEITDGNYALHVWRLPESLWPKPAQEPFATKIRPFRTLEGHTGTVTAIAFSPDGKRAASGSGWVNADRTVRIWDMKTGAEEHVLRGHASQVMGVAFSPDGATLVSAGRDGQLYAWNVETGEQQKVFEPASPRTADLGEVAFTPDGQRIVAAGVASRTLFVWSMKTGQIVHRFTQPDDVHGIALAADGEQVFAALGDGSVRLLELRSGNELRRYNGPPVGAGLFEDGLSDAYCVAVSPDGKRLLAGYKEYVVRHWDVQTAAVLNDLRGSNYNSEFVGFLPGGRYAVSTGTSPSGAAISLFDLSTGQRISTAGGNLPGSGWAGAISPDGQTLLTGGGTHYQAEGGWAKTGDYDLHQWLLPTFKSAPPLQGLEVALRFEGHTEPVHAVAFAPDGKTAFSCGMDQAVIRWDIASGKPLNRWNDHNSQVWSIAVSPDGKQIATGGAGSVVVRNLESGRIQKLLGHEKPVRGIVFAGQHLATASFDGTVRQWDLKSSKEICKLNLEKFVGPISATPDGALLLVAGRPERSHLWNLETCETKRLLDPAPEVWASAMLPNGAMAVTGHLDGAIRLWELNTGDVLRVMVGHTDSPATSVVVTGNGQYCISGGFDKRLCMFDLRTGKGIGQHIVDTHCVTRLAISPDGCYVLSGGGMYFDKNRLQRDGDYALRLWRLPESITQAAQESH